MADVKTFTEHFRQHGWAVIPILPVDEAKSLAGIVRLEALYLVFNSEWKTLQDVSATGVNPSQLLVDPALRKKYLAIPNMVWRNGNTRQPIISKNSGMVNIYLQPQVRKQILFNPRVIDTVRALYQTLPESKGKDEKVCYMNGPDRLGMKAKGSTDMCEALSKTERHIDSNPFFLCKNQHPRYRVQAFVTLQVGVPDKKVTARDLGSIEVLESFHHFYELFGWFINSLHKEGKLGITPFVGVKAHPCDKLLKLWLDPFLTWVQDCIYGSKKETLADELKEFVAKLPSTYIPVKWVIPELKTGELFCFDTRLPHRNTRNKSDVERIVSYVSLYRYSDWEAIKRQPILPMFSSEKATHGGSNRDNAEECAVFATVWKERTTIDLSDSSTCEVLGIQPKVSRLDIED
jgi:hypothetical protein